MKELIISSSESGQRFDKFLGKYLTGVGRSFLYKSMRKKNIVLNGKKAAGNEMLKAGDSVKIFFSDETIEKFTKNVARSEAESLDYNLEIIYENDDIIIANKPAGILSQKSKLDDVSFNDYIVDYIRNNTHSLDSFRAFTPSICNRLDRNTSGIIVAGKTLKGLQSLSKALKDREADKYYLSICYGHVEANIDYEGYLIKDHSSNTVSISSSPIDGADYISTRIIPISTSDEYSLVKIKLITGKTHQIRATLAHIGNPIVGDRKYGNNLSVNAKRQMLHAYEIILDDKSYKAEIPDDFSFMMNKLNLELTNYGNI